MAEILYAPDKERVITTNAWAFLHWLRIVRGIRLPDWAALQRWSTEDPDQFRTAVATFARLPEEPLGLVRRTGAREALVVRCSDGSRVSLAAEQLRPLHRAAALRALPAEVATALDRLWPPADLIRPMADVLLHADLRADDRLLVEGPAWPWLAALLEGTTVILTASTDLLAAAAEEQATILVAPAQRLADATFRRPRQRPDLAALQTIIATGGPMSPEARRRIYTWVKADVMLLARTADTFWGNPLEPVLAQPPATPAFLTPRPSNPATR